MCDTNLNAKPISQLLQRLLEDMPVGGIAAPERLARMNPASTTGALPHVLIIHEVENYPLWKAVFDRAAGLRHAAGERSYQVLRYESGRSPFVFRVSRVGKNPPRSQGESARVYLFAGD